MSSPPVLLLASTTNHCLVFCSPEGPSTPFANPVLATLDVLRLVCVVFAFAIVIATPLAVRRAHDWGQSCRLIGTAAFALVAIDTRVEHLGDFASARLAVDLIGTVLGLAGLWSLYRRESGTTLRRPAGGA